MSYQNISERLTRAQKNNIKSDINSVKGALTFLINLTPAERKNLRKVKAKRISYVNAVLTGIKANPDILPASFSLSEYEKDVNLYNDLLEIMSWLLPLFEGIEDTTMGVGNEAMKQSDTGYAYLKTAAKKSSNQALTNTVETIASQLATGPRTNLIQQ